jgi:pyruvate formate lyase activating enzyme
MTGSFILQLVRGDNLQRGVIFNIQRYSTHDGPGIRTTVFLKGCPLNCLWCHNPESQAPGIEMMYWEKRCIRCMSCVEKCPQGALRREDDSIVYLKHKCILCGICTSICPTKAREVAGKEVTSDLVMKEILKDSIFYDESQGGVTFSGGEPIMQEEFLCELLDRCKDEYIHTVLDTSGFTHWDVLERLVSKVDLFLYDIKIMNSEKHREYTGVPNEIILENLRKLSDRHCRIFVRIPILPGINDDAENLRAMAAYLTDLNIEQVNILPYHDMAIDKYNRLSRQYLMGDIRKPDEESMAKIQYSLSKYGLNVKIGG